MLLFWFYVKNCIASILQTLLNDRALIIEALTDLKAILHSKRANIYYLEHYISNSNGWTTYLKRIWGKDRELKAEGFDPDDADISKALDHFAARMAASADTGNLLLVEAELTKKLYRIAASRVELKDFSRNHGGGDLANDFLNHGNYLAYGLAATSLWVLGIPHGFAVMHGKTRRGALVFDVADLVKDTLVLPWAFICAKEGMREQEFRQQLLKVFTQHQALDFMFDQVKAVAMTADWDAGDA